MNPFYKKIFMGLCMLVASLAATAQVSVTATAGTTGPTAYTTVKAAFDAINAGTHSGAVTIAISGNTTETATASLNSGPYTSLTINATATAIVTGSIAAPLINFNGARNVIINGNNNLQLVNNSTSGTVVRYAADAFSVQIRQVKLKGASTSFDATNGVTGGIVVFDTGITNGNTGNSITGCDFDGGSTAVCAVFSKGLTTTALTENFGDSILNCTIHDIMNPSVAGSAAIFLSAGNDGWVISGNSIFQSVAYSTNNQFVPVGIQIFPTFTSDAHLVTGNFIGGSAANAAGTMSITATGGSAIGYTGLSIQTGGPGNTVSNNTVKNINISYNAAAGSFSNAGIFAFIGGYSGTTTITGNTVTNITGTNNGGSFFYYAIHANGQVTSATSTTPVFTITNNTISNITATGTVTGTGTGDAAIYGMRLESSTRATAAATGKSNPLFTVSGNTITNLNVPFAGTAGTSIRGISTIAAQGSGASGSLHPRVNINNNTISALTTSSAFGTSTANAQFGAGVVTGIHFGGSAGATNNTTDTAKIQQNTIFNLSATNTGDVPVVAIGILATTGIHDISRNRIYDLRNAASGGTNIPGIVGVTVRGLTGPSAVYNNMISLGATQSTNMPIFGILQNFSNTGTGQAVSVYHNSVHISGTASGSRNTYGFYRGDPASAATAVATPVNVRNNIFQNVRSGGTGAHVSIGNANTTAAFTSAYNNLATTSTASVAVWGTNVISLATYQNTTPGDPTSVSSPVTFTDVTTADLHLSGASLTDANLFGTPIAAAGSFLYNRDYDNAVRSTTYPIMGADEVTITCAAPTFSTQPTAQAVCAGENATFTSATTAPGVSYQWLFNNVAIGTGGTNATYVVNNVQAANAGNYSVRITNGCGTTTSNVVALSLNAATAIGTQPLAQAVCAGSPASFTVGATGSGTLTYQWKKDNVNVATGGTGSTLNIATATAADAGSYTVTVTGACGSVTSTPVLLTVNAVTTISTQPVSQTVCAGQSVTFTVGAAGSGNITYDWKKNNVSTGATTNNFTIASAAASDAATYTVTVSGGCGSATSNPATLTVNTGGSCSGSAVSNVSEEVSASVLMPSVVRGSTTLRLTARRAMAVSWTISDAQGRIVKRFTQSVNAGLNDFPLSLQGLGAGSYQLTGFPARGSKISLRFVKL